MLQKSGDAARALENYRNAQEIFEIEPLKSKSPDQLAEMYEGIGDALLALNKNGKNFTDARIMYQLSLDTLTNLQQSGKLNSENIGKLTEIPQKIAKCQSHR